MAIEDRNYPRLDTESVTASGRKSGPMPEQPASRECEFFQVQYIPNLLRGESLNIGIILYCREGSYLGCLFTQDFWRVQRFHKQADLTFFRELQHHFDQQIEDHRDDLAAFLQEIQGYSNIVQIAPSQKLLVCDAGTEIRKLFERYVG